MANMGETSSSSSSLEQGTFFKRFSENRVWYLKSFISDFEGFTGLVMRTLKISGANIAYPVSFSDATISFDKSDTPNFPIGRAFEVAHSMLKEYAQSSPNDPCLPESPEHVDALRKLLQFIDNIDDVYDVLKKGNSPEWDLTLAQHVLSQLSPYPTYKFDINKKYADLCCPCNNKDETFFGVRVDTSFGWENGWHGTVDIIMSDVAVLSYNEKSPSTPSCCCGSGSHSGVSFDVDKKVGSFSYKQYEQIGAKTIAFSFLKNKEQEDGAITMIPTIAISPETVQVHFYDSIKDVFVQSAPVDFIGSEECKIYPRAILLLWLTLNYKLFLTLDDMDVKSGLHQLIDVDKFQREIKSPCHPYDCNGQEWLSNPSWQWDKFKLLSRDRQKRSLCPMKPLSNHPLSNHPLSNHPLKKFLDV